MNKSIVAFAALCTALATPSTASSPVYGVIHLPVPLIGQQTNSWCWAASGEMVMKYFGVTVLQTTQATYQFGASHGVNCATMPTPSACISGGQVEIGHYGFTYNQLGANSCLTPTQIQDQIYSQNEPWIINPNSPGFGHVLVAVGFINLEDIVPNLYFVGINDPWPAVATFNSQGQATGPVNGDFYWEPYDAYKDGVWEGTQHTEGFDYYNIKPPATKPPHIPKVLLGPPALKNLISKSLAQDVLNGNADPTKAANDALLLASKIVTEESAPKLGFPNLAVLAHARLGAPVQQYVMSTPRLKARTARQGANEMLEKGPVLYYPIEGDPTIHAIIRMRKKNGVWRLATFGSPAVASAWQQLQKFGGEFLVEVESSEVALSGRKQGTQLLVTSLFDHPQLGLAARVERKAEDVLPALVDAAKRYTPSLIHL